MAALDWNELTRFEQADVIFIAQHGQRQAVSRWGLMGLQSLAHAGWLRLVRKTPQGCEVYAITEAARTVLLTIPDDIGAERYPLPQDIARMKARLNGSE
jgi:hypothetical protein